MFMNSNTLQVPIALWLMQSLILLVPDLMWEEDDNKNMMLGGALTYLTGNGGTSYPHVYNLSIIKNN